MAHFAMVTSGVVQTVVVIPNDQLIDVNGNESEALGRAYCATLFHTSPDVWVQCSYNAAVTGFRGCYPGQGFSWNGSVFAPPPDPLP